MSRYFVRQGTTEAKLAHKGAQPPVGWVEFVGELTMELSERLIWDDALGNIREATDAELADIRLAERRAAAKARVDGDSPEMLAARAYGLAVRADATATKSERELRDDAKARIDRGEVG